MNKAVEKKVGVFGQKGGGGKSTIALALADVFKYSLKTNVSVVDLDVQGTLTNAYEIGLNKRHKPVSFKKASTSVIICDFPPYNDSNLNIILKEMNVILIPVKITAHDFIAARQMESLLEVLGLKKKACIVFSQVRKPYHNAYKKLKPFFLKVFKDFKVAKTEVSNLVAFEQILEKPISGQAKEEMMRLVNEVLF